MDTLQTVAGAAAWSSSEEANYNNLFFKGYFHELDVMTWFELVLGTHVLHCCSLNSQECHRSLFCHCNPSLYQTATYYSLHPQSFLSSVLIVESCRPFAGENKAMLLILQFLECPVSLHVVRVWMIWGCHLLWNTITYVFWLSVKTSVKILQDQWL